MTAEERRIAQVEAALFGTFYAGQVVTLISVSGKPRVLVLRVNQDGRHVQVKGAFTWRPFRVHVSELEA